MRVSTAFNRLLAVAGVSVAAVRFERDGVVSVLRLRRRRLVCPRCGCLGSAGYDRRLRRWRHLDLGGTRWFLEYALRRFFCPGCRRVVSEAVPWARHGARFTRAFEDVVAWLARQAAFSVIGRLLRITWRSVARIVTRVVAELRPGLPLRLERIGIDEISYRRGQRYLTLVADHSSGCVVWVGQGHSQQTLAGFFDALGRDRTAALRAISVDMWAAYLKAIRERAPNALVCIDPFHVVQQANLAVDKVRKQEWRRLQQAGAPSRWLQQTRWAVLKRPERLSERQTETLALLQRENERLYQAYLLKEQLRAIYAVTPTEAAPLLDAWLDAASHSELPAFRRLARMLKRHRHGVLNAIELGLSNSRLEALNARVRLINHRSYGFHSPEPLIALIHLCCGPLTIQLPT